MHHLFRLRHLVTLAGVIGVGMIPLQACHLELGGAAQYALLGASIGFDGVTDSVTVTSPGIGTNVGSVGTATTSSFTQITAPQELNTPVGPGSPYSEALAAAATLTAVASTEGTNLTSVGGFTDLSAVVSTLGTGILGPGVYYFTNDVALPANTTLTLSGAGEYTFVLSPTATELAFGLNSNVVLVNGANVANVNWVADSVNISAGATVPGQILVRGSATVAGATINGRLQATGDTSSILFVGNTTINQTGLPPHTTVAPALVDGSPATGSGTAASPYFISQGQTLTYSVSGIDPDGALVTLTSTGDEALTGYTESVPLPVTALTPITQVTYAPEAGSALPTQPIAITYTSEDPDGAVCVETVYIQVNAAPTSGALTDVTGEAPFFAGRTGTVDAPLVACVGEPLSFGVSFTDPDFNGADLIGTNNTTLDVTGATGSFTFDPVLPITANPTGTVGTTATFTPAAGDAGVTRTVTFTATDELGATTTQTVAIYTASAPTFAEITQAYNICVGQPLQYTVTATDATTSIPGSDAVPTLELSVVGTPEGATHTPNEELQSGSGALAVEGDVLVTNGSPEGTSSTFNWTPQAGDEGIYTLTYTATNIAGCSTDYQIAITVSSAPTLSVTGVTGTSGGTGTEVDPYLVRVDQTTPFSFNVTGTSVLVEDTVTLGTLGTPAGTTFDPISGNPATGTFSFLPLAEQLNTTLSVTFTATSLLDPTCAAAQPVFFRVVSTGLPTNITLVRSSGAVFGDEFCYTATVLDNTPADQGGPQPLPGVRVCFEVLGTTGNNGQFAVVTDANGQAQYCFTPVFPGTVTVTAVIDENGDCVADDGTTATTDNTTVPAPIPGGTATYINGQGKVAVLPPIFGGGSVAAEFSLDISPKPNGTYKGKINVLIPGAGVNQRGRRTNLKFTSVRINSVTSTDVLGGRTAVIFGVAKITGAGESGLNGNVTFRADVFDGGTPGIGNDSFTITLLNSTTGQALGPIGGILGFGRPTNNGRSSKDDIKIRSGVFSGPRAVRF